MPLLFPQPLVPVTSDSDAAEASFYLVISPAQVPARPAQGKFCITWSLAPTLSGVSDEPSSHEHFFSPQSRNNPFTSSTSLTSVSPSDLPDASGTSQPGCSPAFSEREQSCVCSLQPAISSPSQTRGVCERSRGQRESREIRRRAALKVSSEPPHFLWFVQDGKAVPTTTDANRAFNARLPAAG